MIPGLVRLPHSMAATLPQSSAVTTVRGSRPSWRALRTRMAKSSASIVDRSLSRAPHPCEVVPATGSPRSAGRVPGACARPHWARTLVDHDQIGHSAVPCCGPRTGSRAARSGSRVPCRGTEQGRGSSPRTRTLRPAHHPCLSGGRACPSRSSPALATSSASLTFLHSAAARACRLCRVHKSPPHGARR